MDEKMIKSLAALIDESLAEIEELKKSDRFSASEIKIGDDEGLSGKEKNGSLDKEEKDDEDKDKKEESESKDDDMEKEEDCDDMEKEEDCDDMEKEEDCDDMEKEEDEKDDEEDKKEDKDMKKSLKDQEDLIKSYVDGRIGALEGRLESIAAAVESLRDAPVPSKGSTYRDVQPLTKSVEQVEQLSKSDVVNKLFDLKKSGETVDSVDIASVELGGAGELNKIIQKYNIK